MRELKRFDGEIVLCCVQLRSNPLDGKGFQNLKFQYLFDTGAVQNGNGSVSEFHLADGDIMVPVPQNLVDDTALESKIGLFRPCGKLPGISVEPAFCEIMHFCLHL